MNGEAKPVMEPGGQVFLTSKHEIGIDSTQLPEKKQSWWLRTPRPTVAFDFDGVIHSYKSGWKGEAEVPDPPVPGIREAIAHIRLAGYRVIVVSSRCRSEEGPTGRCQVAPGERHPGGITSQGIRRPPFATLTTGPSVLMGTLGALLEKIINFKPWNYTEKK